MSIRHEVRDSQPRPHASQPMLQIANQSHRQFSLGYQGTENMTPAAPPQGPSEARNKLALTIYSLELEGRFILVENVPARVNAETGERFFAPETVERLQQIVWSGEQPRRVIETSVFEFREGA